MLRTYGILVHSQVDSHMSVLIAQKAFYYVEPVTLSLDRDGQRSWFNSESADGLLDFVNCLGPLLQYNGCDCSFGYVDRSHAQQQLREL